MDDVIKTNESTVKPHGEFTLKIEEKAQAQEFTRQEHVLKINMCRTTFITYKRRKISATIYISWKIKLMPQSNAC